MEGLARLARQRASCCRVPRRPTGGASPARPTAMALRLRWPSNQYMGSAAFLKTSRVLNRSVMIPRFGAWSGLGKPNSDQMTVLAGTNQGPNEGVDRYISRGSLARCAHDGLAAPEHVFASNAFVAAINTVAPRRRGQLPHDLRAAKHGNAEGADPTVRPMAQLNRLEVYIVCIVGLYSSHCPELRGKWGCVGTTVRLDCDWPNVTRDLHRSFPTMSPHWRVTGVIDLTNTYKQTKGLPAPKRREAIFAAMSAHTHQVRMILIPELYYVDELRTWQPSLEETSADMCDRTLAMQPSAVHVQAISVLGSGPLLCGGRYAGMHLRSTLTNFPSQYSPVHESSMALVRSWLRNVTSALDLPCAFIATDDENEVRRLLSWHLEGASTVTANGKNGADHPHHEHHRETKLVFESDLQLAHLFGKSSPDRHDRAMVAKLLVAGSKAFLGTKGSTFSAHIERLRDSGDFHLGPRNSSFDRMATASADTLAQRNDYPFR